ncbi:MAG: UxaA family hydrolase [Lachnospiraceae bacterium]|nr:UxaA family hydrolase [Lachnospiraceae bacterium]MBR1567324.1 UxaA family hydrolase [Lachnospiraceae bacterium]
MGTILQIDKKDNVGIAYSKISAGDHLQISGQSEQDIVAKEDIPVGHKVLLVDRPEGAEIIKYGIPIGRLKEAVRAGAWIHEHNLIDTTEEICDGYCREFIDHVDTIRAYPRPDGGYGVANYVMIFPTSVKANALAKRLSDETGAFWLVADKNLAVDGHLSEKQRHDLIKTALGNNIYAAYILDVEETDEYRVITDALKTADADEGIADAGKVSKALLHRLVQNNTDEQTAREDLLNLIREADSKVRQEVPLEGLTVTVHCAGSDWTTALSGNPVLGIAADYIVKHGGYVYMDEWNGFPGSEHILARQAATREIGLQIIQKVWEVREDIFRKTGKHVEDFNPVPSNKEGGITTLVEKSTGNIKKAGSTPIQGILTPGDRPGIPGVYLLDQRAGAPAATGIYGAMSGAHINVQVTGVGFLYDEIPHLLNIRETGNPETYKNSDYLLDFNAGASFDDETLEETGKRLYEFILDVAQGKAVPKDEADKERALVIPYDGDPTFREEQIFIPTAKGAHREKVANIMS